MVSCPFAAFDCIYLIGQEFLWEPLTQRKDALQRLVTGYSRGSIGAYGNREKPFQLLLTENQDAVWVMPDYVCTIEYMPNTRQALRQPVFKEYRQDICPDEVSIYK